MWHTVKNDIVEIQYDNAYMYGLKDAIKAISLGVKNNKNDM